MHADFHSLNSLQKFLFNLIIHILINLAYFIAIKFTDKEHVTLETAPVQYLVLQIGITDRCCISYNEQMSVKSPQILLKIWGLKILATITSTFKRHYKSCFYLFFPSTIIFLPTSWCFCLVSSAQRGLSPQVVSPIPLRVSPASQQGRKAARNQHLVISLGGFLMIVWGFPFLMWDLFCLKMIFQMFPVALTSPLSNPVAQPHPCIVSVVWDTFLTLFPII